MLGEEIAAVGMNLGAIKVDPNNSQGLDTFLVAKTVCDLLSIHNIGQRLFAKHVLGLSQGTVSELLKKPKLWDTLTEKRREYYRQMYAWSTDERNIVALKVISAKKAQRRRRSSIDERSSDLSSMPKRSRVFISEEQKDKKRLACNQDSHPNLGTKESLAAELNVGVKTVRNWLI